MYRYILIPDYLLASLPVFEHYSDIGKFVRNTKESGYYGVYQLLEEHNL